MSARVIRGNALALPLADNSVDLICTSPPYFALRSYQDAGEHYAGQIGSEATPAAFVDALIAATREMVRVVKPSGSIWVNLGDKYSGAQAQNIGGVNRAGDSARTWAQTNPKRTGIPNKSLMGVPWRYALRCIDDLGLILRAEVIWSKPNGLPESVTDRVRRSHETWFHFTREPRYYSAVDEIREPTEDIGRKAKTVKAGPLTGNHGSSGQDGNGMRMTEVYNNPLGKLPGSVWTIPTEPLKVPAELGIDHFAAFPMEWPRRIIQGWSPSGVCTACGEGRRPVIAKGAPIEFVQTNPKRLAAGQAGNGTVGFRNAPSGQVWNAWKAEHPDTLTGYACACPEPTAPTTPAVVLDPFGGTGTTALVAKALGRRGISVDMSADYCRLAKWRTTDEGELARALQVEKPAVQVEGQTSLLDMLGEVS